MTPKPNNIKWLFARCKSSLAYASSCSLRAIPLCLAYINLAFLAPPLPAHTVAHHPNPCLFLQIMDEIWKIHQFSIDREFENPVYLNSWILLQHNENLSKDIHLSLLKTIRLVRRSYYLSIVLVFEYVLTKHSLL